MRKLIFIYLILFFNCILFAGEYWTEINTGLNNKWNSAGSSCIGCIWLCSDSGRVIRTTNSGFNWINVSNGLPTSYSLTAICGAYLGKSVVAGFNGTTASVWMTRNDGVNWLQVLSQPNGFINAVYMIDTTTGIIIGNPVGGRWSIWKTVNGGYNWDSAGLYLPATATEKGWSNSFLSYSNKIWFGTNNFKIYYSSNFGVTWQVQSTGSEQNIYSISFSDYNYSKGFAGGINLLKTTNGGANWNSISSTGTGIINGISSVDCGSNWIWVWITRNSSNIVYCSSNGGSSWYNAFTAPSGNYTYIYSSTYLGAVFWALRSNGFVTYHWEFEGIKLVNSEIPQQFSLSQNYPNPFNPSTKIKFSLPYPSEGGASYVSLIIYDVLGRIITALIPPLRGGQEGLSPGTYEVEWDASDYPSGIYFYTLKTESFNQTKRMVLVK